MLQKSFTKKVFDARNHNKYNERRAENSIWTFIRMNVSRICNECKFVRALRRETNARSDLYFGPIRDLLRSLIVFNYLLLHLVTPLNTIFSHHSICSNVWCTDRHTHTQCLPFFVYSSYSFHFISLCWYCWWYFLALYVCYFCQSKQQQQKKRIKEKPFRSIEFVYNNLSQHPSSVLLIHFICVLLIARYSSLCNSTKVKRYLYFLYTCRIHSMVIFWLQKGSYHGIIHTHISINIEVFDRKYNKRKQTHISICMRLFGKFSLSFITVWTNDFPYGTKYCFVYGLCVLRNISLDPSYSL